MAREDQYRPELHEPTLQLIGDVWNAHQQNGEINLLDVVRLFAPEIEPDDEARIRSRGTVRFQGTSASGGKFSNQGPEVKVKKSIATITVPPALAGTYRASETEFTLTFDPQRTVSGKALLFNIKLETVSANQALIDVEMSNTGFSQRIIHQQ